MYSIIGTFTRFPVESGSLVCVTSSVALSSAGRCQMTHLAVRSKPGDASGCFFFFTYGPFPWREKHGKKTDPRTMGKDKLSANPSLYPDIQIPKPGLGDVFFVHETAHEDHHILLRMSSPWETVVVFFRPPPGKCSTEDRSIHSSGRKCYSHKWSFCLVISMGLCIP